MGITTNAIVLQHRLPALLKAGLTHLNISLDTLHEHKFEFITRRRGWKQVMAGIDKALDSNLRNVKVAIHESSCKIKIDHSTFMIPVYFK